jgi:hypothetical protein
MESIIEGLHYDVYESHAENTRFSLGKKGIDGNTTYPKCRVIFNRIYRLYEGPDMVQKYWEESVFTHRRVWKNENKNLALRCFEKSGKRYASEVSTYET